MATEIYRLNYTKTADYYRLAIVGDVSGKVAGIKFPTRPAMADARAWLTRKGFVAYGDMLCLSDGSYVSKVRPIAGPVNEIERS